MVNLCGKCRRLKPHSRRGLCRTCKGRLLKAINRMDFKAVLDEVEEFYGDLRRKLRVDPLSMLEQVDI